MIRPYRQKVVVQKDGKIELRSPDLRPGTVAEVIILGPAPAPAATLAAPDRLSDLIGSCKGMFSSPQEADAFLQRERDAWPR
jgi:hypothetical protein